MQHIGRRFDKTAIWGARPNIQILKILARLSTVREQKNPKIQSQPNVELLRKSWLR